LTEDDQDIPVIDLTSTEDRETILAEALAHTALLEAQYKQPLIDEKRTGRWKAPLAIIVFFLSGYLLAFPPGWVAGEALPEASVSAREQGMRAALYVQAQQVEAFRVRRGRLPASMDELQATLPGISLVRSNNRVFQLVTPSVDGSQVIYDSSRPTDEFEAAVSALDLPR
jgi:hypothetical protein